MCFRHLNLDYRNIPPGTPILLQNPVRHGEEHLIFIWLRLDLDCGDDQDHLPPPELPYSATLDAEADVTTGGVNICRFRDGYREALFRGLSFRIR